MGKPHAAFTLVEILVAVAVCSVIASLTYAGFGNAIRSARGVRAVTEIRLLGDTALTYAADNDGRLPQSSHQGPRRSWMRIFKQSLPPEAFRNTFDDTDRLCSYAINDFVTERPHGAPECNYSRIQTISAPSKTLLFGVVHRETRNADHFHFASDGWEPNAFAQQVWTRLVGNAGLYLFVDGHASLIDWEEIKTRLKEPNSRLVRPDGGRLIDEFTQ